MRKLGLQHHHIWSSHVRITLEDHESHEGQANGHQRSSQRPHGCRHERTRRKATLSTPLAVATPRKGKARVKVTASGKKVSYGQAGRAKDGSRRVQPSTKKGDAYCARSAGQMKRSPKAAKNPNSPLRLSRKRWKCAGTKSRRK